MTASPTPKVPLLALGIALLAIAATSLISPAGESTTNGSKTQGQTYNWTHTTYDDDAGEAKDFAFALVDPDTRWIVIEGTKKDFKDSEVTRGRTDGAYLWSRVGKKRWLIDDPALMARAQGIIEPLQELSREQSRLGDLQSSLGDQQSKVGDLQSSVGDRQSELGDQQSALAEKQVDSATDAETQKKLGKKQAELGVQQAELGQEQAKLSKHQATMSRTQADLAQEQAKLNARQKQIKSQVKKELRALVDEAIRKGQARAI